RIIPGGFFITLVWLWPSHAFECIKPQAFNPNDFAILVSLVLLGVAYGIGTIYGGIFKCVRSLVRERRSFELSVFEKHAIDLLNASGGATRPSWIVKWLTKQPATNVSQLWRKIERVHFLFEPVAPHRFRLTVRLLAESHMAARCAISLVLASI